MKITNNTFLKIKHSFINQSYECGGILGSYGDVICIFEFDRGLNLSATNYTPDVNFLSDCISLWDNEEFAGIIHNHNNNKNLSYADIEFAKEIIRLNDLLYIFMFLYINSNNEIIAYKVMNDCIVEEPIETILM